MTGYRSKKDMAQDKLAQPAQEPDEWFEGWRVQDFHDACKKPAQEPVATVQCIHGITIGYLEIMQPVGTKLYTAPPQRQPLPKSEWPNHPSAYEFGSYTGYDKSDLDNYAMRVLAAHGIKEHT